MIINLIGVLAMTLCVGAAERQSSPLSVCELIAHRNEYIGRMVSVRGTVKSGGHGDWLEASSDCQYKLITRGVVWRNIIVLAYPNNRSPIQTDHANFDVDWQAVQDASRDTSRNPFNPHIDHVIMTYIGLFQTHQDLDQRVTPNVPGALKLGFGPGGEAPAQLLIKSLKDVVIVRGGPETK